MKDIAKRIEATREKAGIAVTLTTRLLDEGQVVERLERLKSAIAGYDAQMAYLAEMKELAEEELAALESLVKQSIG